MVFKEKDFLTNFHNALSELIGKEFDKNSDEYTFELMSDMDSKRNYSSMDYYVIDFYRKHTDEPFEISCSKLSQIFTVFSTTHAIYPLNVELSLKETSDKVICVKVDPRFRKFRDLKNHETGHPPFKVIH